MTIPVLTAALLLLPQLPIELSPPQALEGLNVELQIQVTETHFLAQNRSTIEQLVLFGPADGSPITTLKLAPGASISFTFPRGSADELSIEVIALSPLGWTNSGALELSSIREAEGGALWISRDEQRSVGWFQVGNSVQHQSPVGGIAPQALLRAGGSGMHNYSTNSVNLNFSQVPSVTPRPTGGKKPRISPKPLPLM